MGIRISNSKLKTYNQCKRQYHYKFVKNLAPNHTALPLKRGLWLHDLLEAKYVKGDWKPRFKELVKEEWTPLFEEEREKYGDLPGEVQRIMKSYDYRWKEEDKGLTVIAAEQEVEAPLPHGHTLVFRFDLIVEDEFGRWLVEHKSHKSYPSDDYRFLDVQAKKYVWGLNKVKTYGEITGILWNYLRTVPPTIPQLKKDGTPSKRRINTDYYTYLKFLRDNHLDTEDYRDVLSSLKKRSDFFRRERVPAPPVVVKRLVQEAVLTADAIEMGVKPIRSIDRSCDWCSFKEACITSLYGGDEAMVLKNRFHPRKAGEYYADDINVEVG